MKRNQSMLKATLLSFVFFSLAIGTVGTAHFSSADGVSKKAQLNVQKQLQPDEYHEVSGAELTPKIVSCTATSLSRRITAQFESKTLTAFSSVDDDVRYVIDDSNYTGERSDPFKTPQDDKLLDGYTYLAEAKPGQTKLYISNSITYGSRFEVVNLRIAENAMYKKVDFDVSTGTEVVEHDSYKDLTTIYICEGVETVESGALVNVPETVTIQCAAASKPAGWEDDWTDADPSQIEWGVEIDNADKKRVKQNGSPKTVGDAEDFILGYHGDSSTGFGDYPLTLSYTKIHADGTLSTEYQEIPTKHTTNPYDAVGSNIYGNTNAIDIVIDLNKGEDIDTDSIEFYNIFKAQRLYVNEKVAWPNEAIMNVLEKYEVPTTIMGMDEGFVPTLPDNDFFFQTFENENDSYITIAKEFESEEAANALLTTFKGKIETLDVDKDIFQTEDNLKYSHLEKYTEEKYGSVYNLFFPALENPVNIFIQTYVVHNIGIDKYEFVSYIVLDKPVANETESETGEKQISYENSRSLPFSSRQIAIRPFVFVPDYKITCASCNKDFKDNSIFEKQECPECHATGQIKRIPKEKQKAGGVKRFSKIVWINELITTKYATASKFLNYTSLGMTANKVLTTAYAGYTAEDDGSFNTSGNMKAFLLGDDGYYYNGEEPFEASQVKIVGTFKAPAIYVSDNSSRKFVENNLTSILEGKIVFRYTMASLNLASITVTYKKNGEEKVAKIPVKSPSPVFEISEDKGNSITFLINNDNLQGIDTSAITAVGLTGATLNIHLFNKETHNLVQNTQLLHVFGNIEVLPHIKINLPYFNINAYMLLFFAALTLIYAVIAIILFFYKKNKYKNDEFRRMRPKAYVKSALFGYLGLVLIVAAINFIVLRFCFFNSTIPTYNPIDAFVILFSIAAAISIGLFIKNFVAAMKLAKKRREIVRLQLDKDVAEDGTN